MRPAGLFPPARLRCYYCLTRTPSRDRFVRGRLNARVDLERVARSALNLLRLALRAVEVARHEHAVGLGPEEERLAGRCFPSSRPSGPS